VSADEANASLYHYNGTAWVPVDGSTPDPAANAVAGNVTAFSNVSAFAEPDDAPVARLSATQSGGSVVFDASNSTDPDSAIDRYEWDFDGDGTYEETTTAPTTTHAYESGGSYDAAVRVVSKDLDDTASVTVDVGGYGDGGDATDLGSRISIESVEADSDEVQAGDSVRVTARLRNRGQGDDNVVVRLTSDGERVESRTITVPGGERRTVTFDRRFDDPGEYGLSVNGRSLGTVRVLGDAGSGAPTPTPTETPTDSPTPGSAGDGTTAAAGGGSGSGESGETTPTEGGGPGFGAVGALAALLALAALAARRRT
jgi:PGF-CTERM protein